MPTSDNIFQQVKTYQKSDLALLLNSCCLLNNANTKFKDFEKTEANLGSSVSFDLPPRMISTNGLKVTFQNVEQRQHTLSVTQAANTSFAFSAEQFIYNAEQYIDGFGRAAMAELANKIESDLSLNFVSRVRTGNTGSYQTNSGPYRFYGDGTTAINSYKQLAKMLTLYKNYGAPKDNIKVFLPDIVVPDIIGDGLGQFAPKRNDDIAMSWELGSFNGVTYYTSNLFPVYESGNLGEAGTTLTLVSTNDPSGQNVTELTFSGAGGADANAVKSGDLGEFADNVGSFTNLRYLTFIGHHVSANKVQLRVIEDAASSGGNVTVKITPALVWAENKNKNLNVPLQAGMQFTFAPSHHAGLIMGGSPLFVGMPKLPNEVPFPTSNEIDSDTGVSMRSYYGSKFGENERGQIKDAIWGSTLVPEYCMRILFPVS